MTTDNERSDEHKEPCDCINRDTRSPRLAGRSHFCRLCGGTGVLGKSGGSDA